jgi:hypothetical protein
MYTSEINANLKWLNNLECFIGTFARDQLPIINTFPCGLIVNSDPSNKPGEHWTAIFLNKGLGEYFDSYGFPPLHSDVLHFLNKHCPKGWCHNTVMLQSANSMTCGMYCIFYIKLKCLGYTLCEFIKLFTTKASVNDDIVTTLYNKIKNE